jgi:transcriptional regulator with XRE-family HTH domain
MPSSQLPHHLRAHRQRLALSQDDVAFLLGTKAGTQVSRYEHFDRMPTLETALAYEVIMKRSASELFSGMYREAEKKVAERAKELMQTTDVAARKRSVLADLAELSH